MSLGLPGHLAPHSESKAFARGVHVIALVCLLAAFGILLAVQLTWPHITTWPAMLALTPMLPALVLLERHPSTLANAFYLVVGTLSIYLFVAFGTAPFASAIATDTYLLSLPKMARESACSLESCGSPPARCSPRARRQSPRCGPAFVSLRMPRPSRCWWPSSPCS
jgi:hypothetical protein